MRTGLLRRVLETHEEDKVTRYRQLTTASKAGSDYTMYWLPDTERFVLHTTCLVWFHHLSHPPFLVVLSHHRPRLVLGRPRTVIGNWLHEPRVNAGSSIDFMN